LRTITTEAIAAQTTVGPVALTVANLDRVAEFYQSALGLRQHRREGGTAYLGAGREDLVILHEDRSAVAPGRSSGLYHLAILVPSRLALGQSLRHLANMNCLLQGASDHLVSEAIYLADPEGNGIEIYHDRPRSEWPFRDGQLQMATDALDIEGVMEEVMRHGQPWAGVSDDTRIGHVHLRVADIPAAEAFYHGLLGFDVMARYGSAASFLSAGGYHHHLGLNTWGSLGAPAPAEGSRGLRYFTIQLPDENERQRLKARLEAANVPIESTANGLSVRDPSGNRLLLTSPAL
jgi:catechol 2,3-dioxygenase